MIADFQEFTVTFGNIGKVRRFPGEKDRADNLFESRTSFASHKHRLLAFFAANRIGEFPF